MLARAYEMPWRRAYEVYASTTWFVALVATVIASALTQVPMQASVPMAFACLSMAVWRAAQAAHIMVLRAALTGRAMQVIGPVEQEKLTEDPAQVFLGFGFDWLPQHSQRLYELAKIGTG